MAEYDTNPDYDHFRHEAVGNPKRARELLGLLLNGPPDELQRFLALAERPGEGRVREVVAVAYKLLPEPAPALAPWLERWLADEPDEFARRAVRAALDAHRPRARGAPEPDERVALPRDFAATYRYVCERLCHRIRNSLGLPDTQLVRLARVLAAVEDPEARATLTDILSGLRTGFERIAQTVEFDLGDGYLNWSDLSVGEWVRAFGPRYAARLGPARLVVDGRPEAVTARIRAAPFLLDTVFANVWTNAVEALGSGCGISITCSLASSTLELLVHDTGPGFPESVRESVFQAQFSTREGNRGRGLLEIAEAVDRLKGRTRLVPTPAGTYRIQLSFPTVPS